jgi:hypothetical protein
VILAGKQGDSVMSGPLYVKLGQAEPNGILHAAKTETLSDWSGPTAHCGAQLRTTVTRNRMDGTLKCAACRAVLGLETKKTKRRVYAFE